MSLIPLNLIDTTGRLRPVDQDRAMLIAAAMAEEGLRVPVEVRPLNKRGKHVLITGGHRVAAAAILGWDGIEAEILDLSADEAREREINENLYRADLTELERAVFLAEKKRIYEKKHPETRHGGNRRRDQVAIFGHLAPRFTQEMEERLGYSSRQLSRMIARAALPAEVRALIAGTPIANNGSQLDALLRMEPDQQIAVAKLIGRGGEDAPDSVAGAVKVLTGAPQIVTDPADAQFDALMAAWRRCTSRRARDRFLAFLTDEGEVSLIETDAG